MRCTRPRKTCQRRAGFHRPRFANAGLAAIVAATVLAGGLGLAGPTSAALADGTPAVATTPVRQMGVGPNTLIAPAWAGVDQLPPGVDHLPPGSDNCSPCHNPGLFSPALWVATAGDLPTIAPDTTTLGDKWPLYVTLSGFSATDGPVSITLDHRTQLCLLPYDAKADFGALPGKLCSMGPLPDGTHTLTATQASQSASVTVDIMEVSNSGGSPEI